MPAYWIVASTDRWFLTRYAGAASAGIYSIAFNLAMMSTRFSSAFNVVWYPEVARSLATGGDDLPAVIGRQWTRMIGLLSLVWLATTSAGGDLIRVLTPPPYHEAARLVPIIATGSFFYGVSGLSGTGTFVTGQVRSIAVWWTLGSILSLLMNRILVPPFGAVGAALTLLLSFGMIGVGVFISSQKLWTLRISWRDVIYVTALVLAAGIASARPWSSKPLLSLLAKFPVGLAISAAVGWRLAPDWCIRGWRSTVIVFRRVLVRTPDV
jgi:O-antigen/teichoic acid export membrane protein